MTGLLNNYSANITGFGGNSEFPSTGSTQPQSPTAKSSSIDLSPSPSFHSGGFGSGSGTANSPFTGNNMGFFNVMPNAPPPAPPVGTGQQPQIPQLPPPPQGGGMQGGGMTPPPSLAQTQQQQFQRNPGTQGMLNAQQQAPLAQIGHGAMPGMPNQTPGASQNGPMVASQPRQMPQFF